MLTKSGNPLHPSARGKSHCIPYELQPVHWYRMDDYLSNRELGTIIWITIIEKLSGHFGIRK